MLRKQLKSLPATLPQTYERILLNIGQDYRQYALKILQWLTYSKEPLSLLQLAEVVAVDEDEDPRFDPERRFPEPEDILLICSSLVTATEEDCDYFSDDDEASYDDEVSDDDSRQRRRMRVVKVKLAHFSVKEYLVSSQITNGEASHYSIRETDANVRIARDCLSYMLFFTDDIPEPSIFEEEWVCSKFPLARYAARQWTVHARASEQINEESMIELITELFTSEGNAFSSWCLDKYPQSETPLYYTSKEDLVGVVERLITMGVDVNAPSGSYDNALCTASAAGNTEIVKLLLGAGADPNSLKHGWKHGSALYQASKCGYDANAIVRLLLDAGAKAGLEEGNIGDTALHVAAANGNANIVEMLINSGMDVNLKGTRISFTFQKYALGLAGVYGNIETVRLLLEAGANSDSKDDALCFAASQGDDETVKLLLGAGANINQVGGWKDPLRRAVTSGYATTVKILLDAGADVNLGGSWNRDPFVNPLFDSFDREKRREDLEVLELLVAAGARIIGLEEMMKELKDEIELGDKVELHEKLSQRD